MLRPPTPATKPAQTINEVRHVSDSRSVMSLLKYARTANAKRFRPAKHGRLIVFRSSCILGAAAMMFISPIVHYMTHPPQLSGQHCRPIASLGRGSVWRQRSSRTGSRRARICMEPTLQVESAEHRSCFWAWSLGIQHNFGTQTIAVTIPSLSIRRAFSLQSKWQAPQ